MVNDSQLIHEVLVKRSVDFAGRPKTYTMEFMLEKFEAIVFTDPTTEEKSRRKAVQTYLKQFGTGIQKIEEVTLTATNDLIHRFADQNGQPTDFRGFLYHCVFDVIMIFLIGDTIRKEDITMVTESLDKGNEFMTSPSGVILNMFPFMRFFGNKAYKVLMDCYQLKSKLVSAWIESRPTDGFVNFFQSMSNDERKRYGLDTEIAQQNTMWVMLVGGVFTTSTTLSCLINVLCHHPDIQEKMRKEVMNVIGSSRYPSLKDRDNLPYLRATILEIGRFASVFPFAILHKTLQTSTIGQYTIPKDTEVWVNLWAMHHDEKLWDEPFAFKPECFLDAKCKLVPVDHPNHRNVMPFGAGHRVCVGEVFALSRMLLIMARILQNFTILPESTVENQPSYDPRDMTMGVLARPKPFKVRMVPLD